MKNVNLLMVIMAGMLTGLVFYACERYSDYEKSFTRVTLGSEVHESERINSIDTCIGDLLPYQNDFQDTGSILIGFVNVKPQFTASIWSFDDSSIYHLDVSNDTISISNGVVYFNAKSIYGNNPPSVTINDSTYLYPDTIYLGEDVIVWKVCVNPLEQ